jgi:AraC-like DNA-binding protein
MDSRGLERVDWTPFSLFSEYVRSRLPEWGKRIRRQAVVVPPGPSGLILSGLVPLLGMTYEMKFFAGRDEATTWFARPEIPAILAEIDPLIDEAQATTPIVRALRTWLEGKLVGAAIGQAARGLGLSPRTLQRELAAAGTSYKSELLGARVRAATTLLVSTDDKIEVIARKVGCASSSVLASLCRRFAGATPAEIRARRP